jgi:polyphenol oxidase
MNLARASIPGAARDMIVARFPGAPAGRSSAGEPLAILSLASQGSMKQGDPACVSNRDAFLLGLGIEAERARSLSLAHSRSVVFLSGNEDAALPADGILLREPSLAATLTVADCMPIWILDRESGAFGLLHSGWRGTGILAVAIRNLLGRFGSNPASISVILGPAIGSCCYNVPIERAEAFASEHGEKAVSKSGGEWRLDLRAANVAIAESAGVGHLLSIEACTSCDERLGSYRRQGPVSFTRMLAVCGSSGATPNVIGGEP